MKYTRAADPGARRRPERFETGGDELIVLPLAGSCYVLGRRRGVRARGPRERVLRGHRLRLRAARRARRDHRDRAASRCPRLPPRAGSSRATARPRTSRSSCAAPATRRRQVNNFCSPEAFEADALIAVEVLTPTATGRSYPPHKHDEDVPGFEVALEEIYYFEVAARRVRLSARLRRDRIVLAEVRTGDPIDMPCGYHGPSMAAPGYDLYYLNVMAGRASARGISPTTPHTPGSAARGRTRSSTRECR